MRRWPDWTTDLIPRTSRDQSKIWGKCSGMFQRPAKPNAPIGPPDRPVGLRPSDHPARATATRVPHVHARPTTTTPADKRRMQGIIAAFSGKGIAPPELWAALRLTEQKLPGP